jgi:ubiquinone/menaquinone biosynthesis C-methylase UbiE
MAPASARARNAGCAGRSYDLLHLTPGTAVVDVGCGAGRAVAEMAEQGARTVVVDVSEQMIAVARRHRPERDFRLSGAYALPLADGNFILAAVCGHHASHLPSGDCARRLC